MKKILGTIGFGVAAITALAGCSEIKEVNWEIRAACPENSAINISDLSVETLGSDAEATFNVQCLGNNVLSAYVFEPVGAAIAIGPVEGDIAVGIPQESSSSIDVNASYEDIAGWGAADQNPNMSLRLISDGDQRILEVTLVDIQADFSEENLSVRAAA